MAKLGIQMIEMYTQMIHEKFSPVLQDLAAVEQEERRRAEREAEEELGVDILREKKREAQEVVTKIEREIKKLTQNDWQGGKKIEAPLKQLVQSKLARTGRVKDIKAKRDELVDRIKLSGLDDDTKSIFNDLPATIAEVTEEAKALKAAVQPQQIED